MLTMKGQSCFSRRNFSDRTKVLVHATSDGSETLVPNVFGKSLKPNCFKNITKFLRNSNEMKVHGWPGHWK
jgi:hypothetical protein